MNIPNAFVLMPFEDEFNAVYEKVIVPTLSKAGYEVSRADSNIAQQNILRDIVRGIAKAAVVVADLTTMNANVLYELGVAHALRRPTIIIVQQIRDLPFDLRSYRVLEYSAKFTEIGRLEKSLLDLAQHLSANPLEYGNPVVDYLPNEISGENSTEPVARKLEPFGFMDFIVLARPVQQRLEIKMKAINTRIADIANKISSRAAELAELKSSGGGDLMARAYQTVEQAAKETQEFSDAIDVQLPEYRAARGDFEELFLAHISYLQVNESERTAAAGVAHSALDLRKQVESTVQSFVGLRNSFKQARGLSRSMNHALSRADNSVEALISEFSLIISFSVRMINLIGDKLAALDAKTLNP